MHRRNQYCFLRWPVQSSIASSWHALSELPPLQAATGKVEHLLIQALPDPTQSGFAGLTMVAHGYNGATSLTQHLNFPQQPSLLPQPWATAGLAATAAGAQPGASSGACTEQLFRMDGAGSLYRQMPPGLEASLATAAEWSSANAWDASSAPSWLILSACSRSSREVRRSR